MTMRDRGTTLREIAAWWYPEGHLNEDQRDAFVDLLERLRPRACLEIGFASGRSAATTLVTADPEILVSIDLSLDYVPGAREHAARLQARFPALRIVEGDSRGVLSREFFTAHFPRGIDYAFVDGAHSYEACLSDLSAVIPHVNPGGLVVVDDYRSGPPNGVPFGGVNRAVDDVAVRHRLALERWHKDGKGVAILRRASGVDRWRTVLGVVGRRVALGAGRVARGARRRLGRMIGGAPEARA